MTSGTILVIGATGGVGRHVVRCAVEAGLHPRALVRSTERAARLLPVETELVAGEATMPVDMARARAGSTTRRRTSTSWSPARAMAGAAAPRPTGRSPSRSSPGCCSRRTPRPTRPG
ncbi:NAD(P)H-binding protein [Brachybacterium paraconglomeratum]|uniref:NAD(P)H-binding protein n=1 Tax=Brachybacterium paraconglomeratum TaxID=173362 RepID=UPI003FD2C4B8